MFNFFKTWSRIYSKYIPNISGLQLRCQNDDTEWQLPVATIPSSNSMTINKPLVVQRDASEENADGAKTKKSAIRVIIDDYW